jgi:hypothetical protein
MSSVLVVATPWSDIIMVETWPAIARDPPTSPQTSLAHHGQGIRRSHTHRGVHLKECAVVSAGGGPGGGCARTPAGTHLHLHVVGVGNPITVQGLARLEARRGESRQL